MRPPLGIRRPGTRATDTMDGISPPSTTPATSKPRSPSLPAEAGHGNVTGRDPAWT